MTMDQDDRLPAIVEYLKMHPTETLPGAGPGGQAIHIHEHHHYPAPAPPAPPPKPTVAEQVIPWLYTVLIACIIGTVCAFILAVVMVALLIGLLGLALAGAVIAHLIKTTRESQINMELARRPDRRTR
jgi:uncharacterized integral membrane protein